ncbi:TRAP transporter large permease [Pseudoalteromonas ostreae]|uniref:TRAP transporter large permease n=2 Tax=Pseudoalteromonas ostreae TaxID=2774154 RepID=UPI001B377A64|nr:TRAP transporter large permease subunit [Pseudoalteromonas ostreae]
MLALMLIGVPIAFTLGGMGLSMLILADFSPLIGSQALVSSIDSFILLSVPLFLLMSNVLLKGGVGTDLFNAVQTWVGHLPGGLGIATILSCGFFAAISGSSIATAATIGTVAIPEMIKRGYPRHFVFGLLAAGGTLGILIPPSIPMIIYGVITEESIVDLFMAGIGPGIFLVLLFTCYCIFFSIRHKKQQRPAKASMQVRLAASIKASPIFMLAAVILGGIYGGVFTPTESAAIGLICALIIVFLRQSLSIGELHKAIIESLQTTVAIFMIIAGAKIFSKAITLYRIPQDITTLITTNIDQVGLFILLVCSVLLLLGFFLESISMLLIMVPVLLPSLGALGIDPIWFGIIFVIMIECALITPPVGLNLFVIQAVGKADITEVITGVYPFIFLMLAAVIAIYFIPSITTYLPYAL